MQIDCIDILAELESWYASDNGQYLLQGTQRAVQGLLDTSFGYHLLQLGVRGGRPLYEGSPINHRLYCAARSGEDVGLVSEPCELPLDSHSIDAIIAHHSLEFAANPHQVLREIQRVLTPQGQLLIVGFNPYSLMGCNTRIRGMLRDPLWSGHTPVSEHRLRDWLHLLGCEVLDTFRLYSLPPVGRGRVRNFVARCDNWAERKNLPLGGLYILHATKQVAGLHRPRRSLRSRRERFVGLVPKPAPTTPLTPAPHSNNPLYKGDVAA